MTYPIAAVRGGKNLRKLGSTLSPLLTGLAHYWKLDEASGNRVDSIGTFNLIPSGVVGNEAGLLGNAATFGGSPNYLYANVTSFNIPDTGGTVSGWIKLSTNARASIMRSSNDVNLNSGGNWSLWYNGSNSWRFYILDSDNTNNTFPILTSTTNTAVWYFLCGTFYAAIRLKTYPHSLKPPAL